MKRNLRDVSEVCCDLINFASREIEALSITGTLTQVFSVQNPAVVNIPVHRSSYFSHYPWFASSTSFHFKKK
jgi:hypothetical protein